MLNFANKKPIITPKNICFKNKIVAKSMLSFCKIAIAITTKTNDIGSLLPLSISSSSAVFSFNCEFFECSMEKIEAASVDAMTEPIKKLSLISIFKI